ncbi:MAG: S24 family peptidase [Saprospiraceae bacterium]
MNSPISQRFISCFDELIAKAVCRSARHFATSLDLAPQSLNEILKGRREINIEIIEKAVAVFNINSNFLFTGLGPKFLKEEYTKDLNILTIIANLDHEESIIHVPIPAQAGYVGRNIDPVFVHELPKYSIPLARIKTDGSMRSYEVDGESMLPTLHKGDIVISCYLHHITWENSLKEGPIYVLITKTDVLVKRLTNRLREERKLILHSDNLTYPSYSLKLEEIKEIWLVKAKISTELQKIKGTETNMEFELGQLKQLLLTQGSLLEDIADKLDS